MQVLDGVLFCKMISAGVMELQAHAKEINDLNVFPIPDGDTGDNMLLTVRGGTSPDFERDGIGEAAGMIARGMLLSARGNSGVILSQFFEGVKCGFSGLSSAGAKEMGDAFRKGVEQAYGAVMRPTEGTVLTVMREATEYACTVNTDSLEAFLSAFIEEARRSLARTPEILPVLKQAGVVDSGAAGFICIIEGMLRFLRGDEYIPVSEAADSVSEEIDVNAFTEDSVLEYGYCTELLVRLQNSKTDIPNFDEKAVTDYLCSIGDSVVCVCSGSILKLHVHTFTPDKVLAFCQNYGEFLKVKIENMSLQHNSLNGENTEIYRVEEEKERKKYGIVAVAAGEGLKQVFIDMGADFVVEGGQSANPSAEELISAIRRVNAETVFVLPNNSNVILTAKQAAQLCDDVDVRVVESRNVGEGYAAISMYTEGLGDADEIYSELCEAMDGVLTAEISRCVRDAEFGEGVMLHKGEYIGFIGKRLLAVSGERYDTLKKTVEAIAPSEYDVCILISGRDASADEVEQFKRCFAANYRGKELYTVDGGQEIFDYILIFE
ncbi:MAG: DAK2 domain-containing protein [Clostridia bacterium]|nr:DAK2 domain-containing protein [Clostridia bacterium]